MELRQQRRADNERVVRRLGERMVGELAIVCECARTACTEHLDVTRDEWRRVRESEAQFFVRPGHEEPGERVVEADERFLVVESS